jgi:hypothetical protein
MKKTFISIAVVTFFTLQLSSCAGPPSGLDQFVGKWKGINKYDKDTMIIKKEDGNIFIFKGKGEKDTLTAIYDQPNNRLKVYCISTVLMSFGKNDHLLADQGNDGEYERIGVKP